MVLLTSSLPRRRMARAYCTMARAPLRDGDRVLEGRRQGMEVVDLPLGEFRHHVEAPETFQFAHEVIGEIAQQLLRLQARLFGDGARLLRLGLGAAGALAAEIGQHGSQNRGGREHGAAGGDLAGAHQRVARR